MLNLESLNYLNQNNSIKNTSSKDISSKDISSKNENIKVENKDFNSYLSKEKELNNKNITNKSEDKDSTVEKMKEVEPLNIDKETSDKISGKIKENLETDNNEDSKGNIEEILEVISSLFNKNDIIVEDIDLENIEELLTDTFDELKTTILNNDNENINLLNMINPMNLKEINLEPVSLELPSLEGTSLVELINLKQKNYEEILVNINDLLGKAVSLVENNESLTSNPSLELVEIELKNSITDLFNTLDSEEFKTVVNGMEKDDKSNLLNTIKSLLNNEKNKETLVKEVNLPIKENNIEVTNLLKSDVSNENNSGAFEDEYLKEEKVLSKVINNNSENKFTNILTTSYDRFNNVTTKVEQVPVYKETMNADIIQNVKYMVTNKIEELTVKIYPKELGEITIKILSEEGIIRADIKATSKETYALLNSNIQELKNNLSDQNIKIQEVNLGIYNEDTTFFSNEEHNSKESEKGKSSNNKIINGDLIDEKVDDILSDNSVNMLA